MTLAVSCVVSTQENKTVRKFDGSIAGADHLRDGLLKRLGNQNVVFVEGNGLVCGALVG